MRYRLVLAVECVLLCLVQPFLHSGRDAIDYLQLEEIGARVVEGGRPDIYSGAGRAALLEQYLARPPRSAVDSAVRSETVRRFGRVGFYSVASPALFIVSGLLYGGLPFLAGYRLHLVLSILVFSLSVILLAERLGVRRPLVPILLPLLALGFGSIASDLDVGNVNILVASLLWLVPIRWPARPVSAGLLAGVVLALKPVGALAVLLLAAYEVLSRRSWRFVAGVALGATAVLAASLAFVPAAAWPAWAEATRATSSLLGRVRLGNNGVASSLYHLTGFDASIPLLVVSLAVAAGLLLPRGRDRFSGYRLFSWGLVAAVWASPLSWYQYGCYLIAPLVVQLAVGAGQRSRWSTAVLLAGVVCLSRLSGPVVALLPFLRDYPSALGQTLFVVAFCLEFPAARSDRRGTDAPPAGAWPSRNPA